MILPHHILIPNRFISPILYFENYRSAFERAECVPGAGRNVDGADRPRRRDLIGRRTDALELIIELLDHAPAKHDDRLRCLLMPVYRHDRPWLDRIQHPLRRIRRRIAQVIIHPQPRRCFCLLGEGVQQSRIYLYFHSHQYFLNTTSKASA